MDEWITKPIPNYWPEEMDYVALASFIREEEEGYSLLKLEFRVPIYFKFSSEYDVQELLVEMYKKAELFKKIGVDIRDKESQEGLNDKMS